MDEQDSWQDEVVVMDQESDSDSEQGDDFVPPPNLAALVQQLGAGHLMDMISGVGNPGIGLHHADGNGPASTAERERVSSARHHIQLQQALAVHCSHVATVLRQLPWNLPPELVWMIAELSCDVATVAGSIMCSCEHEHPLVSSPVVDPTGTIEWSSGGPTAPCLTVCSHCGKACVASCTPRVPPDAVGGEWARLRTARTTAGQVIFKRNHHFMFEHAKSAQRGRQYAVRHRLSGLHSFRAVVASEWVVHGRATYEIRLDGLRSRASPLAFSVGCVAPTCHINSTLGWEPGGTHPGSWGFTVERRQTEEEETPEDEVRAISNPETELACGGYFCPPSLEGLEEAGSENSWQSGYDPQLQCDGLKDVQVGDRLHATIDATARTFRLEVWREGSGCVVSCLLGMYRHISDDDGDDALCSRMGHHMERGEPLALCVALKYANDGVTVRRLCFETLLRGRLSWWARVDSRRGRRTY